MGSSRPFMIRNLAGIPFDQFFAEYWRKKPVLLRGAARHILDSRLSAADFESLADKLEKIHPQLVQRQSEVIFAQRLDLASDTLWRRSQEYERALLCQRVWFDGVLATGAGGVRGIGCHYDHSDNFVIQQMGRKLWRVGPSRFLPEAEQRQRVLEDAPVGAFYMPDEHYTFLLEEDDVLYLPLFWSHWGISRGPSLSLSLVFNIDNPLELLLPMLRSALSHEKSWWHPLPVFPVTEPRPEMTIPDEIDAIFDRMVDVLQSPDLRNRLKEGWWREGLLRTQEEAEGADAAEEVERDGSVYKLFERTIDPEPIGLNFPRADALVAKASQAIINPRSLIWPGSDHEALAALRHRASVGLYRRMLHLSVTIAPRAERLSGWAETLEAIRRSQHWTAEETGSRMLRPELVSWVWRTTENLWHLYPPRFIEIVFALPALLVAAEQDSGVDSSGAGSLRVVGDGWLVEQYPKAGRFGAKPLAEGCSQIVLENLSAAVIAGIEKLRFAWPEAANELCRLVTVVSPLAAGAGGHASVAPFFGLVALEALEPEAMAMALIDELGRAKVGLCQALPLVQSKDEEHDAAGLWPPGERDATALYPLQCALGGMYVTALTKKLSRPTRKIAAASGQALDHIRENPALTAAGLELAEGIAEGVDRVNS